MDRHAAATYYVLYRLTELGFDASPTGSAQADVVACTPDGGRVVLVRVRSREGGEWNTTAADRRPVGRNVAYVFLDFDGGDAEPRAFVLRGALVQSLLESDAGFPREVRRAAVLDDYRDAWHVLGLGHRSRPRSSSAVSSSPVL